MRLCFLYQFNEKYAPYAGTSIYSILLNNREAEDICIYILGEELSDESTKKLRQMVEDFARTIVFLDSKPLVEKMRKLDIPTYRGSYAANMRLFLDEVLPKEEKRILYLDADTIVDSEIQTLFQTQMQGKTIGMVLDSLGESHKLQIGLEMQDAYYNSGVILFDLQKWREKQYSTKIATHVKQKRNNYPAPDQDLLNVVCCRDIFRLDLVYNFQPIHKAFTAQQFYRVMHPNVYYEKKQIQDAVKKPVIYHCFRYLGEFPWDKKNMHPFCDKFDYYLKQSPWKDYQKKKANTGLIIGIEKLMYLVLPRGLFLPIFRIGHRMFLQQSERDSLQNKTNKLM